MAGVFPPSGPWYAGGLRFSCRGCGECCRGPGGYVWVTADEAAGLARALGIEPGAFFAEWLRRTAAGLALVDGSTGDCPLLDAAGRCGAYGARPVQCRTWPWWRENLGSPGEWERAARRCPGMGKGELHSRPAIDAEAEKDF